MKIVLFANNRKPDALAAAQELYALLSDRADVVLLTSPETLAIVHAQPDLVVVLGGDGSILHVAPQVAELGVPVVGINFGKLGYLTAFSLQEFKWHLELLLSGKFVCSHRLMIQGALYDHLGPIAPTWDELQLRQPRFARHALNDIVVNAGEPFRMIELHLRINGQESAGIRGDGVVVATSSGSTGYNLSAGGPLISPDVHALVLTPICAHSLSFRPVVLADTTTILIHAHRVNPGTRVNFDGQTTQPLSEGDCVVVRRTPKPLKLVENPSLSHWQMLATKLHWAQSPRHS